MANRKDDFIDWDDIDLDDLLGEYTDDDFYSVDNACSASSSDSDSEDGVGNCNVVVTAMDDVQDHVQDSSISSKVGKVKQQQSRHAQIYSCPVCQKDLRSISGFRGHVMKQHPQFNRTGFRICDYKKDPAGSDVAITAATTSSRTEHTPALSGGINESDFRQIFSSSNSNAWKSIIDDPVLSLKSSCHGPVLLQHASCLAQYCDNLVDTTVLYGVLKDIFTRRLLISQCDRESLMIDIQSVRLSEEAVLAFGNFATRYIPSCDMASYKLLFQVWLRKIVIELISSMSVTLSNIEQSDSSSLTRPLSDIDQSILFHISGYLAMKVRKACFRYKKMRSLQSLTHCLATNEPQQSGHFVEKYKQWVEKQSRGGLMYPIPNFYLLVRELDSVYRSCVTQSGLHASSLCKSSLQLAMYESFMVKYYWNKLVELAHVDEVKSMPVLDYVMSLFVTIKGFAIARKERDALKLNAEKLKKAKHNVKQSKSLRGNLKRK